MTTDDPFPPIRLEGWDKAKAALSALHSNWIFRGLPSAEYELTTSLERHAAGRHFDASYYEDVLLEEFQRRAHQYLAPGSAPDRDDYMEWWALMQHFGAPTRLMDWTDSPYVAAFFALDEAKGDAAVWAIDTYQCHQAFVRHCQQYFPEAFPEIPGRYDFWSTEEVERLLQFQQFSFVVPLVPFRVNERLTIQQGRFLVPANVRNTFVDNLLAYGTEQVRRMVRKFILPKDMRQVALRDLNAMNVNRATLFPGLDGFAASLRNWPLIYDERLKRLG